MTQIPNNEQRKHAMITAEQEILLRAFASAKKMKFGEFTLFFQGGNIVRYEIKKSTSMIDAKKTANVEVIQEAAADLEAFEEIIAIG